ncbi:hypothetical protein NZD89_05340 [Alicyclobacillus fastidiosus]|uniref:Uncharacterized protein n=1 Tax=Alicyclobacillus fastidiosus TaxID=392011 RepID=A0ABY6ZL71_9BACL|nr:hypothetical protein [Alicyclobacillus fastidiosus]WAH42854.1 hypothetical protein NZD89_05340 [Alicyclobacillus fastidiosus]GMA64789.1 hypothetical protein GCM10025859_52290 [Alicyclobacillus fastidiosus]
MTAPIYMYFIVFTKLAILGFALLGGVPLLERFVERQEKKLSGSTRIVHRGSMKYVEIISQSDKSNENVAV